MDKNKDCMLKEITSFLIKVGEHCLEYNSKIVIEHNTEPDEEPTTNVTPKKQRKHNVKISYLEKWINNIDYDVFTLEQFYNVYPMQKKNRKLSSVISRLISEKKILQLGKNKFKVI